MSLKSDLRWALVAAALVVVAAVAWLLLRDRAAPVVQESADPLPTPVATIELLAADPPETLAPSPSPFPAPTERPATPEPTALPTATEAEGQAVFMPLVDQDDAAAGQTEPELAAATPTAAPEAVPQKEKAAPRPMSLADWPALTLPEWPRPVGDNGFCIHNITEQYYHDENVDLQISRLKQMGMHWTLMLYGDENQLMRAAPRFRDAGITVVWRKMLRPYESYYGWGRDIELLKQLGVEPYMQVYNEPSLPAEWTGGHRSDRALFLDNFISAVEQIYNAGGYVGLQFVSDDWLVAALDEIKARGGEKVFGRTFLVPHPYGLNHPPDYTEDPNGVLGFLHQADVVREQLGFVPPMIAGEGGWKWNATDDNRFPPIDATLHRDYHVALFDWFRTGTLSNGQPLPDYLFAFCPWLLSSKLDDSAWFDSFAGDHTPTIEAVQSMSDFVRQFNWQR